MAALRYQCDAFPLPEAVLFYAGKVKNTNGQSMLPHKINQVYIIFIQVKLL